MARCPTGPEVVASGRLVQWVQASAGQRWGTAGPQSGHAPRQWAVAAAAALGLRPPRQAKARWPAWRNNPARGQPGPAAHAGRLCPAQAHNRLGAGAVPPWGREPRGSASRLTGPGREPPGARGRAVVSAGGAARAGAQRPTSPAPAAVLGQPRWLLHKRRESPAGTGAAPRPRLALTGAPLRGRPLLAEAGPRAQHSCEAAEEPLQGALPAPPRWCPRRKPCVGQPHGVGPSAAPGSQRTSPTADGARPCTAAKKPTPAPRRGLSLDNGGLIRVRRRTGPCTPHRTSAARRRVSASQQEGGTFGTPLLTVHATGQACRRSRPPETCTSALPTST